MLNVKLEGSMMDGNTNFKGADLEGTNWSNVTFSYVRAPIFDTFVRIVPPEFLETKNKEEKGAAQTSSSRRSARFYAKDGKSMDALIDEEKGFLTPEEALAAEAEEDQIISDYIAVDADKWRLHRCGCLLFPTPVWSAMWAETKILYAADVQTLALHSEGAKINH